MVHSIENTFTRENYQYWQMYINFSSVVKKSTIIMLHFTYI